MTEKSKLKKKIYQKKYYPKWAKKNAEYLRGYRLAKKKRVFDHYGHECNCCGELEPKFLTIDHVNADGHKERKSRGGQSNNMHVTIINKGFPDSYQILCYNCNMGKSRNDNVCPHL